MIHLQVLLVFQRKDRHPKNDFQFTNKHNRLTAKNINHYEEEEKIELYMILSVFPLLSVPSKIVFTSIHSCINSLPPHSTKRTPSTDLEICLQYFFIKHHDLFVKFQLEPKMAVKRSPRRKRAMIKWMIDVINGE